MSCACPDPPDETSRVSPFIAVPLVNPIFPPDPTYFIKLFVPETVRLYDGNCAFVSFTDAEPPVDPAE